MCPCHRRIEGHRSHSSDGGNAPLQAGCNPGCQSPDLLPVFRPTAMNTAEIYQRRLNRYVTAMRNEKPDCVPIRPFVAEFTAKYAGFTNQEVTHDYDKAFAAARKCASLFDWDAVVGNMVYVWTGLTQALTTRYYAIPGIDIPASSGFQYLEPSEDNAFMREDEYDHLIDDPDGFPVQRLAAAHLARGAGPGRTRHLARQSGADQGHHGHVPVLQRLRRSTCTPHPRVRHRVRHLRHPQGAVRHHRRQTARLHRPDHGHGGTTGQGAGGLRGAHAPPVSRGAGHRRRAEAGAHRLLDAPRLRAVHHPGAVRLALLADPQADHRGFVGARAPDAVLCRRQLELSPRFLRRTARQQHRLSCGPRRHVRGPPQDRPQVLPERRHSQHSAELRHAGRGAGLLQTHHRRSGRGRRLHHGRQRDHAGRHLHREHDRPHRFHPRIRQSIPPRGIRHSRARCGRATARMPPPCTRLRPSRRPAKRRAPSCHGRKKRPSCPQPSKTNRCSNASGPKPTPRPICSSISACCHSDIRFFPNPIPADPP